MKLGGNRYTVQAKWKGGRTDAYVSIVEGERGPFPPPPKKVVRRNFNLFHLCFTNEIRGLFTTFFLLMWGFFYYLKALLLRFSPFGGAFSPFKGLSATFFLYVEVFFLRFSCGESFFLPFEGLSATFFFPCGSVVFGFIGTLFSLPHPLPKFRRGLMPACPLTPMSSMQYNDSLTASCHFRDILK